MIFPVCVCGQNNYNLSLVGSYNWKLWSWLMTSEGSDIWGWENQTTGVEYALVGIK